jgi:hypothetical protein
MNKSIRIKEGYWFVQRVTRPNAGILFNAVMILDGKVVECDHTPTHSPTAAEALARKLNNRSKK